MRLTETCAANYCGSDILVFGVWGIEMRSEVVHRAMGVRDYGRNVIISVGRYGVGVDRIDKGRGEIEVDVLKRE